MSLCHMLERYCLVSAKLKEHCAVYVLFVDFRYQSVSVCLYTHVSPYSPPSATPANFDLHSQGLAKRADCQI